MTKTRILLFAVAVLTAVLPAKAVDEELPSAFGSVTNPGAALIGIFYDLKQTQKRDYIDPKFVETYQEFLRSRWDENVLNRYFRGTRPVYATQVYVPNIGAGAAPKAFKLEKVVKPTQWVVIYKGQVSPPEDGEYRFVGVADDIMAVAIADKTVLVSNLGDGEESDSWQPPDPKAAIPGGEYYTMQRGDWFTARKGQPIDLEVLIGERPGTYFGAWLMIEKKGMEYPVIQDPNFGPRTVLPLFQVAPQTVDASSQPVPFSSNGPVWVCHQ